MMNCIAIDDEALALDVVEAYLEKFPQIKLLNKFRSTVAAMEFLNHNKVDLIFLDIEMPDLNGIQLLRNINPENTPLIVFTTAHSEYAIDSYNYKVVDYLLKPIEFERFCKAINKAKELFQLKSGENTPSLQKTFLIKSSGKYYRTKADEIFYLEGKGNYVMFRLKDKKILSLFTMQEALALLPPNFVRVHKSFIINVDFIESIDLTTVTIDKNDIPVGNTYKEDVKLLIERMLSS